jgi:hypothetical protein
MMVYLDSKIAAYRGRINQILLYNNSYIQVSNIEKNWQEDFWFPSF